MVNVYLLNFYYLLSAVLDSRGKSRDGAEKVSVLKELMFWWEQRTIKK